MSIKQPKNKNFLAPIGFDFALQRTPNVEYFVQSVNVPSITSGEAIHATQFSDIKFQPDHLFYEQLKLTLILDEDMDSWKEIFNWLTGISFPQNHKQHRDLVTGVKNPFPTFRSNPPGDIYSNATVLVRTNKSNGNIQFTYHDLYPTSISELNFSSTEGSVDYITFDVTFNYLYYDMKLV
jgi:hypothetical protein